MTIEIAGLACVVTGAGRGIGRAEAMELGRRGARVLVNDVDEETAKTTTADIRAAGGEAVPSVADVGTPDGGAALIDQMINEFGRVDVVVNNAGTRRPGYFGTLTVAEIDAVLDSHLRAAFFVTQPAWARMSEQGFGRIVFTSSSSGMFSNQGLSNYAAAKAGLYGLMKAVAYEGLDIGITANAVLPFAATRRPGEVRVPDMAEHRQKRIRPDLLTEVPAWRGDTQLIASLVAALVSRQCSITGEAISACNGRYGRVFVGVADGWLAPSLEAATAEAIEANLDVIRDVGKSTVPKWIFDENARVLEQLQAASFTTAP